MGWDRVQFVDSLAILFPGSACVTAWRGQPEKQTRLWRAAEAHRKPRLSATGPTEVRPDIHPGVRNRTAKKYKASHGEGQPLSACLWAAEIVASAASDDLCQPDGNTSPPISTRRFAGRAGTCAAESATPANLSAWSSSRAKRIFDCACVALALPFVIPVLLLVALCVRATSAGPVLFLQQRVGRGGQRFTILKFRTLSRGEGDRTGELRFTQIGRFLRRWKLDELPQVFNVLAGDMSLVGPRPKMPEYELEDPCCRPGITGAATIVFACEEDLLHQSPSLRSGDVYRSVVMPAKLRLDKEYMARATFASDLRLLASTLLRRWDVEGLRTVIGDVNADLRSIAAGPHSLRLREETHLPGPALPSLDCIASAEVASQL